MARYIFHGKDSAEIDEIKERIEGLRSLGAKTLATQTDYPSRTVVLHISVNPGDPWDKELTDLLLEYDIRKRQPAEAG